MSAEIKKEIQLEIAHVLFIDIVGYSKLSVNEQHASIEELNEIVHLSEQFLKAEEANRILKIPTGDGMALVFYKSPEEPAQCAFEISRALKNNQRLQVRMGIHSGPISGVVDVNRRTNVAGAGINVAQRVMDCGDAEHILLSRHVAEDLEEYERWRPYLHDIGTFEVKHGVRVSVTNLYSDEVGNSQLPKKFEAVRKHRAHVRWAAVTIGLLVIGAIVAAFMIVSRRPTTSLTAIPEKSIAVLPFVDMSAGKDERVLLRRHLGGTVEPAGEDSAIAGDGAHLVVRVQGQGDRESRRSRARCMWRTCSKARCARRATRYGSRRS